MRNFILRRLAVGLLMIIVVSIVVFALLYSQSESIARNVIGEAATPEQIAQKASELGLDRPLYEQYIDWWRGMFTDLGGRSWFSGQFVLVSIGNRLGVTLSLVIGATLVTAVVAVLLGLAAGVRGGWIDRLVQIVSVVGFAVPAYIVALGLISVFAIQLGWFRATGWTPTFPLGWLTSATLPILALSLAGIANVTQQVRGSVLDVMRRDYIRTLRSRGLPERRVVMVHALRNASGPALSVLGIYFVALLSATVIVEQVFAIPGVGQLAVQSAQSVDIPVVMGVVVVSSIIVVLVNLSVDLLQAALTPKARES